MFDHAMTLPESLRARTPTRPRMTLGRRVVLMWEAARTRRILAEMEPRLLKDIGVSRSEAEAEAARAPWDIRPRR